jgi:hypothetical protein
VNVKQKYQDELIRQLDEAGISSPTIMKNIDISNDIKLPTFPKQKGKEN